MQVSHTSREPASEPPHTLKSRPKIVAIDDQPDSLRLLQIRLQSAQMECITFRSGQEGLDFLKEHPVDVIILDVMMPVMDGYAVCRQLKENLVTRDIPVIFLTAKFDPADKVQGLEVGGHDYLSKPVEHQELLARTKAALRVKQLQDELKNKIQLQEQVAQLHQQMVSAHWEKTLGQLAASLAHEINNPLAAALGSTQLLTMDENTSKESLERLHVLEQSLQRAAKKLQSLLLIAQPSQHAQIYSLSRLVEDILALTNFLAVTNKVTLSHQIHPGCESQGRPAEIARAVLYVLNNAIEAVTEKPKARVQVLVERHNGMNCIRILDNGLGIPSDVQHQIFEAFQTTKKQPHNGLGLFLANRIITSAGGKLELHAPNQEGLTELRIALPSTQ